MSTLRPTVGQTVGPFFHYGLEFEGDNQLVPAGHADAIRFHGQVVDGAGWPVPDALIEIWQPDSAGAPVQRPGSLNRDGWTFTGWGRCATDRDGRYSFTTLRPGSKTSAAPFFAVTIFARGLLNRLFTRAYLPDDVDALAEVPLLRDAGDRRDRLIATADATGYVFDIGLQGPHETVFLSHVARSTAH